MSRVPPFPAEVREQLAAFGWADDSRAEEPLAVIWSGPDPEGAVRRLLSFLEVRPDLLDDPVATNRIAHLAGGSRELMRQLILHPDWLADSEPPDLLGRVRATLIRVAADDLAGSIDVSHGGRILSELADQTIERVLSDVLTDGAPPTAVIAYGKWGGNELNYWSDIDLGFVFAGGPAEAATANRVAAAVMAGLRNGGGSEVLFNADADLRPEGSRGPLARSLDAYRSYYSRWAEPWEFQALLKVRHAGGDPEIGGEFIGLVEEVLWPDTLDPDMIRALRHLKARSEESAHPDDLKRAPGGIRDIEFAVQLLQLVHGRFDPELRRTGTLDLLAALTAGGYVHGGDADALAEAYRWLRALEHRIQLWDLRPTHLLVAVPEERERLARAMGYRGTSAASALDQLEADLVRHRTTVRRIHEALYFRPLLEAFAATPTTGLTREGAERRLQALGFRDVSRAVVSFDELTAGLSRRSRLMQQMLPLVIDWLADTPDPDLGLEQLRLLAANLPDHAELITTLHDRPVVGQRLTQLLGSSRLLGSYLDRIPEFVPRLDDDDSLTRLRPAGELAGRLQERIETRRQPEERLGTLRRFARRQLVRVAARDLLGMADVARTMGDLTASADAAMAVAVAEAGGEEGFVTVAMGRWGGRELSYGSDLDLLYVFSDPLTAEEATAIAHRLRELLAAPARDGVAFELDADLRPEGRSGPLVRSLSSYDSYYQRWAATWEYQALIKARPVAGDPDLADAFTEMIQPHVWRDPFPGEFANQVRHMKARVEKERVPAGEDPDFHLKLGPGGLVDIEFLVQLLQLRHGGTRSHLRTPSTLDALELLARSELLDTDHTHDLAAAYRFCTHVRNRLFLQMGRRVDSLPRDPVEERKLAFSLGYRRRGELREEYRRVTRRARRIFDDLFYS